MRKPVIFFEFLVFCSLISCYKNPISINYFHTNPSDVSIISSDISNFWTAFDSIGTSQIQSSKQIFKSTYFGNASKGLNDYSTIENLNDSNLSNAVYNNYPDFYKSIRARTDEICSNESKNELNNWFIDFDSIVPDAQFADVYYVIGNLSAGGKISSNGIIISLEFFSTNDSTVLSELPINYQNLLKSFKGTNTITAIIIHELAHINQSTSISNKSLLSQAIIEGAADFITLIVTGIQLNT